MEEIQEMEEILEMEEIQEIQEMKEGCHPEGCHPEGCHLEGCHPERERRGDPVRDRPGELQWRRICQTRALRCRMECQTRARTEPQNRHCHSCLASQSRSRRSICPSMSEQIFEDHRLLLMQRSRCQFGLWKD